MVDLLQRPYTEARVADIPRRLQAYFKSRGYYDVKVTATGAPGRQAMGACRCRSRFQPARFIILMGSA